MNKKFLSAILFGALMVTSTGTFVSCKDYDDDIENLQGQIDGLKSTLSGDIQILKSDLAAAAAEAAAAKAAAADAKAAAVAAGDAAAEAAADAKAEAAKAKAEAIAAAEAKIAELEEEVAATSAANTAALNALKAEFNALKTSVKELFATRLTSLVLNPDLYYGGIEAVKIQAIEYYALTLGSVSPNADNSKDAPVKATTLTQMTPMLQATYHMNPSTADLSGLTASNFKFIVDEKETKSRAIPFKNDVTSFVTANGDLTVSSKFVGYTFKDTDSKISTLALEVALDEESVVTSDYAAVYAEKITGFILDNESTPLVCDELPTSAAAAIAGKPLVKVAWNETVDLAKYVETHLKSATACTAWAESKLEAAGFGYVYELVGYNDGVNLTSQSAHAALNASVLRPQLPVDGKAAAWEAAEQSPATVGRMPLVRVILKDNNSNKNVAVGYIKLEIVATPGKNTVGAQASYTFTSEPDGFTLSCNDKDYEHKVKWYQIEETILKQLAISKEEFVANYKFSDILYKSYDATTGEAVKLALTADEIKVAVVVDELEGTTTEVLKMTVKPGYAYEYFLKGNKVMTAIIRYAKETGIDALGNKCYDYAYVTLNWAPNPLNVTPEGTIADADKIKQYWFADDNATAGTGYDEIHVNVNVPGEGNVTETNFDKAILETFVDGNITISGVEKVYADFQDEDLTKELVFAPTQMTTPLVGVSGKSYAIKVGTNNKELYAHEIVAGVPSLTGSLIATLAADGTIAYEATAAAKDILNAAGRDELVKNVTATVLVKETNGCEKSLVKLNNNTFDVKFLRPISVAQAEMDSFKDGVDVGAKGSEVAVKLNFTDWRGYDFKIDADYNYYTHYGVESIAVKTDDKGNKLYTTNVSGAWAKLPEGMKVDYAPATSIGVKDDFGKLTYVNNNTEVGDFIIRVPLVVTYVWGTIELVIEVEVEKTV